MSCKPWRIGFAREPAPRLSEPSPFARGSMSLSTQLFRFVSRRASLPEETQRATPSIIMQSQRRAFLKILAATPLVACSGGSSGAAASFGKVSAGNVAETREGVISVVPNAPAVLARDTGGLYAMTITCTHQGCDVTPSGTVLPARRSCTSQSRSTPLAT
jgi:hypothetical protein